MKHTKEHPGFGPVAAEIARKMGVPIERGRAILAAKTRGTSAKGKRRNPRLKRVKG